MKFANKAPLPASLLLVSLAALSFAACAETTRGNSAAADTPPPAQAQSEVPASGADGILQKRAGQTLGVSPAQVAISDIEREGGLAGRINFTASASGVRYGCYVTSGGGATSDAICTRPNAGGMVNLGNNPLLHEANRLNPR